MNDGMGSLAINEEQRRLIALAAQGTYPDECCGILIGGESAERVTVAKICQASNLSPTPANHYVIDPRDLLAAERDARAANLDVVGYWHSHPDVPATPSARDLADAWEGVVYVIVPVMKGTAGEPRAWRLKGAAFVELTLKG